MSGAHVAIHAAQERRKTQDEEENMTRYNRQELEGEWEFKIIRSVTSAFKNPATLNMVLRQESQGEWQLVEKFDDQRLRLKRPASARAQDSARPGGYDPYRTRYGISEGALAIWVTLGIFGTLALGMLIAFLAGASF